MLGTIPVLPAGASAKALAFLKKTGPSAAAWSESLGSVEPTITARELAPYCAVLAPLVMEKGSPEILLLYPCTIQPPRAACKTRLPDLMKGLPVPNGSSDFQVTVATWVWLKSALP